MVTLFARRPGFDIRDEPDDCYDATGQFPHLTAIHDMAYRDAEDDVDDHLALDSDRLVAEADEPSSRHRTAACIALALAATSAAGVLAARPHASGRPQPARGTPAGLRTAAPKPAPVAAIPLPSKTPAAPQSRPVAQQQTPRPSRKPRVAAARSITVRPVPRPAEPAGGEFVLGAR